MSNRFLAHFLVSKISISLSAATVAGLIVTANLPASAASLIPVDLELSLLIDVSDSVDDREYALQIGGYKNAFTKLSSRFGTGGFGSVAINLIEWSGSRQQRQSIPWTLLNDQASALQFADTIGMLLRPFGGNTVPGSAIQFATPLFSSNDFDGRRWVIDVSGDGADSIAVFIGVPARVGRDNALAAGVTNINGLPIVTGSGSGLEAWYRNNIQGGPGSFVVTANGFEDFDQAIETKLGLELALPPREVIPEPGSPPSTEAVPEPTTMLGIALAGSGLAYLKRRQRSV